MTIESIAEQGTFSINEKHGYTCDKIFRDGNYYSSKPPVLSFIGAGFYYILHKYLNLDFPSLEKYTDNSLAVYLMTLILTGLPFLLLLFYFYKAINLIEKKTKVKIKKKYCALLIFGLGLGTLYMPYSSTLNNHIAAGSFLFISFYYLLKVKFNKTQTKKINLYLIASGFFASLSSVIDLPTGLTFLGLFFLYFLFTLRSKKIIYYLLASIPLLIIHLYLNVQITGDFLPAQLHPEYWADFRRMIVKRNIFIYTFNILFGSRGLFFYSPILFFSFYAIYKIINPVPLLQNIISCLKKLNLHLSLLYKQQNILKQCWIKNKKHLFYKEAFLISIGFLIIILFYIIKIRDYGGASYAFRWLIAVTPLLYFFTIFLFIKPTNKLKTIFLLILILSIMISAVGLYNPWLSSGIEIPILNKTIIIHSSFLYNLFFMFVFPNAQPNKVNLN
ncbi:MAG: hypothetical protein GWO87_01555 [Xanthomonadaceae bacterium]|nr:hypothetical protein [Rhodospirillaceae bacterium]NIA17858.1 hypothetical protein [Xanthomonadaceae bacterium]